MDKESEKSFPGKEVSLSKGPGTERACHLEEQKEGRVTGSKICRATAVRQPVLWAMRGAGF